MIDGNRGRCQPWYDVRVGHFAVRVQGATPQEAILAARRQLCVDLPRLWDVIQAMEPSRFSVQSVDTWEQQIVAPN